MIGGVVEFHCKGECFATYDTWHLQRIPLLHDMKCLAGIASPATTVTRANLNWDDIFAFEVDGIISD